MNRREALKLFGAVGITSMIHPAPVAQQKIGRVTPETHRGRVRVFLDGVDVTNSSYAADDVAGYVDMYVRDANGRIILSYGDAMQERKYGDVRIELIEAQS